MERIIYDLDLFGMFFKADFNFNYELLSHISEARTERGYVRVDYVRNKRNNRTFLSRRIVNFPHNKGMIEKMFIDDK